MEKTIKQLKSIRTRYTNKPNQEKELAAINKLWNTVEEKVGFMKALPTDLAEYLTKALEGKTPKEEVRAANGKMYQVDTIKGTCKRILKDFTELVDLEIPEMDLQVYQRYLKDHFDGEDAPLKKGKLFFRGYRISCTIENGFMLEDTTKKYKIVETGFEGIPTPKELGEFFKKPKREFTVEEEREAIERGKQISKSRESLATMAQEMAEEEEIDYELPRRKVLSKIKAVRDKKCVGFDPEDFLSMIPFKKWRRQSKALYKRWTSKEIRYPKFLNLLEEVTTQMEFVEEDKTKYEKFVGTLLPTFTEVGSLKGDKIEVDGKWVDAVPFMVDYLLHYEPKVMPQLMKWAKGELDAVSLVKEPIVKDRTIEFHKRAFVNSAENAKVLDAVFFSAGLVSPQDLVYKADLVVGDKIMIVINEEWKTKTITSVEEGVEFTGGIGLMKTDKWIKLQEVK